MRIAGNLLLTAVTLAIAMPAWAVTDDHRQPSAVGEVQIPYYDVGGVFDTYLQSGSRSAAEGTALRHRFGGGYWQYSWNKLTGTLHDIYGDALRVHEGMFSSREQVDMAARAFIRENADLLGAREGELALYDIVNGNRKWYVRYQQVVNGIRVHRAFIKLQLTEDGRLIRFGSDFHPYLSLPGAAVLSSDAARDAALAGVPFDAATDRVEDRGLLILPLPSSGMDETAAEYRLVHDLLVVTEEGPGRYETFVDASSGEILRRHNDIQFVDLTGSVTGRVNEATYCVPPYSDLGLEDLRIFVDGVGYTYTDEAGDFVIDVPDGLPKPVEIRLKGYHVSTNNQAPGQLDARIDTTGTPGTPLNIYWEEGNSTQAERDCFYHVNRIYDHFKAIVGSYSLGGLESQLPCNVNMDNTCNAYWNGSSINFYEAGGGCGNTGQISDVIYHEYGHGLDNFLAYGIGAAQLSEGVPDIIATMLTGQSRVGRGFYAASCNLVLRDCNNSLRYPQNLTGEPYGDGKIICGFAWDVHLNYQAVGIPDSHDDSLLTFTLLTDPANQPEFVTQWFIEDDDDGILNNGTPTYDQLCDAAGQHGFSCPEIFQGVIVSHSPHGDTNNTVDPYELIAVIGSTEGPIDSAYVYYSLNMGGFTPLAMTPTGNPSEFTAAIPAQAEGSLVRYYILGADPPFRATSPEDAPGLAHSIVVSSVGLSAHQTWDMEATDDWTVGDQIPPDTATAGIWERGDPDEVIAWVGGHPLPATPEDDTTPEPGINCWFTEQEVEGHLAGDHDVDGGKTTLRSPVFSLSGLQFVRLRYNRWFTNALGSNKSEDPFTVGLSTNGGLTYVTIEETLISASEWQETLVDLNGAIEFGSNMRLRFVARDQESGEYGPSIVEAAVDDVVIQKWPIEGGAVGEGALAGAVPVRFHLGQNSPNPFNPATAIDFAVAATGPVQLRVFNVNGQLVRSLVDAPLATGSYSITWDGRNDLGAQVATGVYYYRIDAPEFNQTLKMVLLK